MNSVHRNEQSELREMRRQALRAAEESRHAIDRALFAAWERPHAALTTDSVCPPDLEGERASSSSQFFWRRRPGPTQRIRRHAGA